MRVKRGEVRKGGGGAGRPISQIQQRGGVGKGVGTNALNQVEAEESVVGKGGGGLKRRISESNPQTYTSVSWRLLARKPVGMRVSWLKERVLRGRGGVNDARYPLHLLDIQSDQGG